MGKKKLFELPESIPADDVFDMIIKTEKKQNTCNIFDVIYRLNKDIQDLKKENVRINKILDDLTIR